MGPTSNFCSTKFPVYYKPIRNDRCRNVINNGVKRCHAPCVLCVCVCVSVTGLRASSAYQGRAPPIVDLSIEGYEDGHILGVRTVHTTMYSYVDWHDNDLCNSQGLFVRENMCICVTFVQTNHKHCKSRGAVRLLGWCEIATVLSSTCTLYMHIALRVFKWHLKVWITFKVH